MKQIGMTMLLLWSWGNLLCSQTSDNVATFHYGNGSVLNVVDASGQKQGLWVYYRISLNAIGSPLSMKRSDTCFQQLSTGRFLNNKKVGVWDFFHDGGCFVARSKRETFDSDGSVQEDQLNMITHYSPDSSRVVSTIFEVTDTICIQCEGKKTCVANYRNRIVNTFPYENLWLERYGFSIGFYRRKLQLSTH